MPRTNTNESVLTLAVSKSKSLRTTVPIHIVDLLKLKEKDRLEWTLDKKETEWIVVIKKK